MTLDYAYFAAASTLIHSAQGAALLLLGAAEAAELEKPGTRWAYLGPAALLAAAAATPLLMLALPGRWDPALLRLALEARRGFHIFIAFACLFGAAGLARLTQLLLGREGGGWRAAFLAFLAFSGVLYFATASRVNESAWRQVLFWHSAAGATLLLAVALKAAGLFYPRRWLLTGWAGLLIAAGVQLLAYRETPDAFGLKLVTLQSAPDMPPPGARAPLFKDAGPADKERPGR